MCTFFLVFILHVNSKHIGINDILIQSCNHTKMQSNQLYLIAIGLWFMCSRKCFWFIHKRKTWWTALNKMSYLNSLMKVQRQAELCKSEALKTTPSADLDILLNLPCLYKVGEKTLLKPQPSDWELTTCGSLLTSVTQI